MAVTGKVTGNQPILNMPGKGNSVADVSFKQWTLTNSGTTDTTGIFGESSGARNFDGTNDFISGDSTLSNEIATAIDNQGTIIFDFYSDVTNKTAMIFGNYNNTVENSFLVQVSSASNIGIFTYNGSTSLGSGVTSYSATTWINMCYSCLSGVIDVYKDAVYQATLTPSGAIKTNSTQGLVMGKRIDTNVFYDGKMCNVKTFKKNLNKNEVLIITRQKGRVNY
jgi:hypothetical protein